MGRPLKIQNSTPKSLKEMSNSEIEFVSHVILSDFVSTSTGTGTISVNPGDTTGLTGIGSFIDTKFTGVVIGDKLAQYVGGYENVYQQDYSGTFDTTFLGVYVGNYTRTFSGFSGPTYLGNYTGNYTRAYLGTYSTLYTRAFSGTFSPGIGGLLTNTDYNFYQDLRTVSESVERPLESRSGGIKQQDDDAINEYIIGVTNDYYLNNGLGNYVLQTTTPSYGGTWTQISTIVDTNQTSNTNYYLWRRTDQTPPSTTRPLKYRLNGNRYDLIEMSNTEIQTLSARFRNRIVETGVGKFVLQETAPVSGTWVQRGVDVTDTRQDVAVENFAVEYTKEYEGSYTGASYTATYQRDYAGTFDGLSYTATYSGAYSGLSYEGIEYTGLFVGEYAASYDGAYTGLFDRTYLGLYLGNYVGNYTRTFSGFNGPTYLGDYTGNYTGNYTASFQGSYVGLFDGAIYAGEYDRLYQATYEGTYEGSFDGLLYTGTYEGVYVGAFDGISYSGTYTGLFNTNYPAVNYPASVIQSSLETISTVKLWQRTA